MHCGDLARELLGLAAMGAVSWMLLPSVGARNAELIGPCTTWCVAAVGPHMGTLRWIRESCWCWVLSADCGGLGCVVRFECVVLELDVGLLT